jgi:hypothetical protein
VDRSIPRHLQVAQPLRISLHSHSPLPVIEAAGHGLIGLACLDNKVQIGGLKLPLDGVGLALGAAPGFTRGEDNGFRGEQPAAAVPFDQDAVAVLGLVFWIGAARFGAQARRSGRHFPYPGAGRSGVRGVGIGQTLTCLKVAFETGSYKVGPSLLADLEAGGGAIAGLCEGEAGAPLLWA